MASANGALRLPLFASASPLVHLIVGLLLQLPLTQQSHAFDRDHCEFATSDYSLEWAYEPQTANVVFVLRQNATLSDASAFWTGVGFNSTRVSCGERSIASSSLCARRLQKKPLDFIGILVRKTRVALADAYLNGAGVLYTDVVPNVKTIGHEYDGRTLVVKFARPLVSPDLVNDHSLAGCVTFLLPRK